MEGEKLNGEKLCRTCLYGENPAGAIQCRNRTVHKLGDEYKPDPYFCEFYDPISDDYMADIDKVLEDE